MVVRYSIRKWRGKWSINMIEIGKIIRVSHLKDYDSWSDAVSDVVFLINADRALNKALNKSFN